MWCGRTAPGFAASPSPASAAGAPKWSPDGTRVVFYEIPVEQTWAAHWPGLDASTTSQIVSVDVESGERQVHTRRSWPEGDAAVPDQRRHRLPRQGGADARPGLHRRGRRGRRRHALAGVVARRQARRVRASRLQAAAAEPAPCTAGTRITSIATRTSSRASRRTASCLVTRKDGDSSLDIMDADGSNRREVFPSNGGSAFSPSWSPDGQSIVFGYGGFLQSRAASRRRS